MIKAQVKEVKPVGKLLPIINIIDSNIVLDDVMKILEYKMSLK